MEIEESKIRRGNIAPSSSVGLLESYSARRSSNLNQENKKVVKLIHQKIYPLNHSQRSASMFPKIKEKYSKDVQKPGKEAKNYIEISLEENQGNNILQKSRTDLEDQHIGKGRLKCKKNSRKYTSCFRKTVNQKSKFPNKSQIVHLDRCLMSDKIGNTNMYDENWQNATFFYTQAQRIFVQQLLHSNFLKKINENIEKQKNSYYNNLNFAQLFANLAGTQKQKCSIQFLVNAIENKVGKDVSNYLPYQQSSPNKLAQFAKLFQKNKKGLLLWQQLELTEPALQKQRPSAEQLKSMHHIRRNNRNKTIVQQQSQINLENILTAKYRIKNNHKRMIELSKKNVV